MWGEGRRRSLETEFRNFLFYASKKKIVTFRNYSESNKQHTIVLHYHKKHECMRERIILSGTTDSHSKPIHFSNTAHDTAFNVRIASLVHTDSHNWSIVVESTFLC